MSSYDHKPCQILFIDRKIKSKRENNKKKSKMSSLNFKAILLARFFGS